MNNPETSSSNEQPNYESKYKGVRKRKWGKWVSEIRLPNSRERIWLGSYDSPEKAARAFDAAQFCLRGCHASFNFPQSPPEIADAESLSPHQIQIAAAKFANEQNSQSTATDNDNNSLREGGVLRDSSSPAMTESTVNVHGGEMSIDWSFLDALNSNDKYGCSVFPLSPLLPEYIIEEDEEIYVDEYCSQPPFLWSFDN